MREITIRRAVIFLIMIVTMSFEASMATMYDNTDMKEAVSEYIRIEKWKAECIRRTLIIRSIMMVESNNNPLAYNKSEDAAGIVQIRRIMVREVNRLVGYAKYTYADRWSEEKSIAMFTDYQNHVNPSWNAEIAARKWNGGYYGDRKPSTRLYWTLVKGHLKNMV